MFFMYSVSEIHGETTKINKFTRKQFFGNSQQFSSFLKMVCTVYIGTRDGM